MMLLRIFASILSLLSLSIPTAAETPNIIVIMADDLGYGDVSCYGAAALQTPNIDRLAAEGLRFTNGYCSASTCTPTRFSFLTGTYAYEDPAKPTGHGAAFLAIQIEALMPRMEFQARMRNLMKEIRQTPKADGVESILFPGEPEEQYRQRARQQGLNLPSDVWASVETVAREWNVELPAMDSRSPFSNENQKAE